MLLEVSQYTKLKQNYRDVLQDRSNAKRKYCTQTSEGMERGLCEERPVLLDCI